MNRIISTCILALLLFLNTANLVLAQEAGTLLPEKSVSVDCTTLMNDLQITADPVTAFKEKSTNKKNDILSCAIITGKIKFWMIPYFIVYFIEFAIGLSGLVAIFFLVIAGFQYIMSGASEAQDKAKGTIKNALIGLVIVLVAWVVVNLIQFALTI
jgi:hypothetical protein